MALIRTLARVDSEGKIALPRNIRIALGLKEQDVLELRVVGTKLMVKRETKPRAGLGRYADTNR